MRGEHAAGGLQEFQLELAPPAPLRKCSAAGAEVAAAGTPLGPPWEGLHALLLDPGEWVGSPLLVPGPEHVMELLLAAPADPGLRLRMLVEVRGPAEGAGWSVLATAEMGGELRMQRLQLHLAGLAGQACRFRLRRADASAAQAGVALWRICPQLRSARVNALAGYAHRLHNEIHNFSAAAYTHAMYGPTPGHAASGGEVAVARITPAADAQAPAAAAVAREAAGRLAGLPALAGEAAYDYAYRALEALLPTQPPHFLERVYRLSEARPLRVLSLLCGAARIEERMLAHCPGEVDLTLIDASPELLRRAADRLASGSARRRVRCLAGDVNDGLPGDGEYDLIVCVSALHHVADLETVLAQVNRRLAADGEFWSVGEQVGRNGNRLWPDALAAANAAFRELPARLRLNAHSRQVDESVSDRDFSLGCFEGIRSEELQHLLEAHLVPVEVDTRNAFLWRLVDATYCDNFVLADPEDLQHLRRLIAAEAAHWVGGGRGTELNGIYRKKRLR